MIYRIDVSMLTKSVHPQCGKSWVPVPVGSNQTLLQLCCFSANHAVLRRMSKDGLARHDDNVSLWSGMSTREFTETTVCVKTCRFTRLGHIPVPSQLLNNVYVSEKQQQGFEPTIYHIRGEQPKFYTGWKGLISHIYQFLGICALVALLPSSIYGIWYHPTLLSSKKKADRLDHYLNIG